MKLVRLQVGAAHWDSTIRHITRARYSHGHAILLSHGCTRWRRFTGWHPCAEDRSRSGGGHGQITPLPILRARNACEMLDWARESQSELKSGARRVSDGFGRYSYLPVYWYYPVLSERSTHSVRSLGSRVFCARSIATARSSFQGPVLTTLESQTSAVCSRGPAWPWRRLACFALTRPPPLPFSPQRGERGLMSRPYGVAQHAVTTQSPDSGKFPGH